MHWPNEDLHYGSHAKKLPCVWPLKGKNPNEKHIQMANTLERLVNLQEEMATNFNNFLKRECHEKFFV